jgi:glycosyltransferase involved in cell wall biosynthesis
MEEHYLDDFRLKGPLRSFVKSQLGTLRKWDRTTARRVDLFIANSKATQERIRRFYGRESIVLHPPVDESFFTIPLSNPNPNPNPYFLAVGRLVPYKRFDLLIELANAEKLTLKIVGSGPDAPRLKRLAGSTVEFLGYVPDEALPTLYRDATAFLYPTYEDAGIALLEAQACGTPAVAFGRGGALDTVIDGETGILFKKQDLESLHVALKRLEGMRFDPEKLRAHARKFSSERFRGRLREIVTSSVEAKPQ